VEDLRTRRIQQRRTEDAEITIGLEAVCARLRAARIHALTGLRWRLHKEPPAESNLGSPLAPGDMISRARPI
jgi:hypothetical protein